MTETCEGCRHWTRSSSSGVSPTRGTCRALCVLDGYYLAKGAVLLDAPSRQNAGTWDSFGCPLHDGRPKPFHVTVDPKHCVFHVVLRSSDEIVGEWKDKNNAFYTRDWLNEHWRDDD